MLLILVAISHIHTCMSGQSVHHTVIATGCLACMSPIVAVMLDARELSDPSNYAELSDGSNYA